MSSERRTGHERFRNLFKTASKEQIPGKAKLGTPEKQPRGRISTSPFKNGKPALSKEKSMKSMKKRSGERNKPSSKTRKKSAATNSPSPSPAKPPETFGNHTDRRASKSPHARTPRTPTTPPVIHGSRPRTPGKKQQPPSSGSAQKYNGQDVHEKTQMCNTVFENDVGGMPSSGEGGAAIPTIQLAAARIKERKLQWKKEESTGKTEPMSHDSGSHESGHEEEKKTSKTASKEGSREEIKEIKLLPEAGVTVRDHTVFENDENPAPVKEEERKLQWAPGAAREASSEPAVRKKKSSADERGAMSDRPPRDAPAKPPRGVPVPSMCLPVLRTPVKTATGHSPVATTPLTSAMAPSPTTKPLMLDVATTCGSAEGTAFGTEEAPKEDPKATPVSCYLAPNMQTQAFTPAAKKNSQLDSEPYEP